MSKNMGIYFGKKAREIMKKSVMSRSWSLYWVSKILS